MRGWLSSRFRARALVLGYHRVDAPGRDPFDLTVSAGVLRRQLEHVRSRAHFVRLSHLTAGLASGTVPPGSVALTFDDAYATSMSVLRPILEEMQIPATVFVPTGLLGREPWWDRLERITDRGGPAPERVAAGGTAVRLPPDRPDTVLRTLYDELSRLDDAPREDLLAALDDAWPDDGTREVRARRVVTDQELVTLAASELVDVGSHSHSHPFLAALPEARQRAEVETSKRMLEALLGARVELFSYPNGSCTPTTPELVRRAGYAGACASHPDVVTGRSDPFRIPRLWPGDRESDVTRALTFWLG